MSLLITKPAEDRNLYVLETKYAFARFILDSITNENERAHFQNSMKTEITTTIKQITTHYQLESVLYNKINIKQRIKYYKASTKAALVNNRWKQDVKLFDGNSSLDYVWNIRELEIFNIPPLSLGKWKLIHSKYSMNNTGYALPIYTLHGIDTLQTVIVDFISRFEIADTEFILDVENVQNIIFYKLSYGKSLIVLWLDSVNLPTTWKSNYPEKGDDVQLLNRCYMMTHNIQYINNSILDDPVVNSLLEYIINAPFHLYSEDMPYDLYNFPNLSCIRDTTLTYNSIEIWDQMSRFEEKYYILAQQLPRTFSNLSMSVEKLLYWISKDKIPSNLLLRHVNNSIRNYVKNSFVKFFYIHPQHKSVYVLNLSVRNHRELKLPNLGPLLPPTLLPTHSFESSIDCLQIMQSVYYLGIFKTIIFTDVAIRPVSNTITEDEIVEQLSAVRTIHIKQLDRVIQNYFNQDGYKYELIANIKDIKFIRISYADLICYAFITDGHSDENNIQIQFNSYDILLKILMVNKQKIFTNYRNLGIVISHFIDYYNSFQQTHSLLTT